MRSPIKMILPAVMPVSMSVLVSAALSLGISAGIFALDVPLPKVKPGSVTATAPATATTPRPVYDDGRPVITASPLPVTPKTKPEIPVNLSALIPWVMPSRSYVATTEEVGKPGAMLCNLTFDDGPHKTLDPLILEILKKYNAKATFYLVGRNVKRLPETTRAIAAAGHEIGHHSWKHDNLRKLGRAAIARDIRRTSDIIEKTTGKRPTMFRPPYGNHNKAVLAEAKRQGMETLLWSVDSLDWKKISPETVRKRVVDRAAPGSVILMHSIQKRTATALPAILEGLRKKGCVFVTSSEWVKAVTG